jgi:hypothetical protein
VDFNQPTTQRRRSERVSKALTVVVRGIDLLGQPFEEKTSTLSFNLHGCRYSSRHHLPKNTWVTLEVPQNSGGKHVRARVAWIQRPHSTRDYFQVAVELESPANIWEMDLWTIEGTSVAASLVQSYSFDNPLPNDENDISNSREIEFSQESSIPGEPIGNVMEDTARTTFEAASEPPLKHFSSAAESPLLRELSAELRRQAKEAVDSEASATAEKFRTSVDAIEGKRLETQRIFESWMEQFERAQTAARAELGAHVDTAREDLRASLRSASESDFDKIRELTETLAQRSEELHAQHEATMAAISRMAEMHLRAEAEESARARQRENAVSQEHSDPSEIAVAQWKERLAAEMSVAKAQWDELLQSSLDSNVQRIAAQLSAQSRDTLRGAEERITERIAELRAPLAQVSSDAREAVASVRAVLDQEVSRARGSLADIEQSAGRMKEYSAQLEAANHDTLNELHRRLETILDTQTDELNRRAEKLAADLPGRVLPPLESITEQFIARSFADVESKLAPYFKRTSELLRELAAREIQVEEGLRLHRERLRQLSENNQREVSAQLGAAVAGLSTDIKALRAEALVKWTEELDANGVRASQSASEAIGRASEWFQQEARARLQVLVEQTVVAAGTSFEEKTREAAQKFAIDLDAQSAERRARIQEQLNEAVDGATVQAGSRFTEAAEVAASSFGQVIRGISEQEAERFGAESRDTLRARALELDEVVQKVSRDADAAAEVSIERFRAQFTSQLGDSLSEGRAALASEFHAALEGYRTKRDAHQKDWAASLDQLTREAAERYQERLEATCDTWIAASAGRLNEQGRDVIDSLIRSADQALRESCTRVFEGLTEILRGRIAGSSGVAGFAAQASRDTPDAPHASQ